MSTAIEPGYRRLLLRPAGFIEANGPLYGRVDGGRLILGVRVEPRHGNPVGGCHGGMLMFLADITLALGSGFQEKLDRFLPTVSLSVDFVAPAPVGAWIEGQCEVLRRTRSLVFSQGRLSVAGAIVARMSGIYRLPAEADAERATLGFAD